MPRVSAPKMKQGYKITPIPNNLGEVRAMKNMRMSLVAEKVGVAEGTYGSFEAGFSLPAKLVLDNIVKVFALESAAAIYSPNIIVLIEGQYEKARKSWEDASE